MGIPMEDVELRNKYGNVLNTKQAILKNLKTISSYDYLLLRRTHYISEILKQISNTLLLLGGVCMVLVGDPVALVKIYMEQFCT